MDALLESLNSLKLVVATKDDVDRIVKTLEAQFRSEFKARDDKIAALETEMEQLKKANTEYAQRIESRLSNLEHAIISPPPVSSTNPSPDCSDLDPRTIELADFNPIHPPKESYEPVIENTKTNIDLLVIGDSIVKYMNTDKFYPGAVVISIPGARCIQIFSRLVELALRYNLKRVVIHVGSNYIPEFNPHRIAKEINDFLRGISDWLPEVEFAFSSTLPKFNDTYLPGIKQINNLIGEACTDQGIAFISNGSFYLKNGKGNGKLICNDGVHPSYRGVAAMEKSIFELLLIWGLV